MLRALPLAVLAGAAIAGAAATFFEPYRNVSIRRISRVVADLDRSEAFYRDGLGFVCTSRADGDPAFAALLGLSATSMQESVMHLGSQEIALVWFDPPGAPYPAASHSDDLWFQHLAIVVSDMAAAHRMLSTQVPLSISTNGPETLPARNGGVSAFKFRDPDGHPLELLYFPPGQGRDLWRSLAASPFLGIDHTALAASATARSVRFYRRLGFAVSARSLNNGPAQARLDGIPGADLRVTGLRPSHGEGPGIELLAYRPPGRRAPPTLANDAVTDWVTIEVPSLRHAPRVLRDPDGHLMVLVPGPIQPPPR